MIATIDEMRAIRRAISLLNSMVNSGETHTETSESVIEEAYKVLDNVIIVKPQD